MAPPQRSAGFGTVSSSSSSPTTRTFSFNRASLTGLPFATGKGGAATLSSGMLCCVGSWTALALHWHTEVSNSNHYYYYYCSQDAGVFTLWIDCF
jgi:hypothetical protein